MNKHEYKQLSTLQTHGIDVQQDSNVKPNTGSESWPHFQAKACVAYLGQINGYRVDSEVEFDNGKECDILLWGHDSRNTLVVETETNWNDQVLEAKLNQYVEPYPPIDDMLCIEVLDLPENSMDVLEYVSHQIGLYP
jgi:hypothetical protein